MAAPTDGKRGRWLLRAVDPGAEGRLFALPYSGCGASMYRQWPRFHGGLELCPVQPPGRESRMRERPYERYDELADALIAALEPDFDRPFGLFGHCGSALAAYETAVRLQARGGPLPACVFVSSQVAPHRGPYGSYLTMDDGELAGELARLIRQMGGEPMPDLIDLCLDVMRADVRANAAYVVPQPVRLDCRLTALGWRADVNVPPSLMDGWQDCGRTTYRLLEGDHFRFLAAPAALLSTFSRDIGIASGAGEATAGGRRPGTAD
jgi:surfactin synthase thioesterase subunit